MAIKKHRFIILLIFMLSVVISSVAQQTAYFRTQQKYFWWQRSSNITIEQGNGLSSLLIASDIKDVNRIGFTTNLIVGYTYFWERTAGFHTGLGIRYARSGFAADGVESQSMGYMIAYNNESSVKRRTHYTATITSVKENYNAFFLELPIQLVYQYRQFWFDYGFKIFLPISVKGAYDYGETVIGAGYTIDGFGTDVPAPIEFDRLDARSGTYTVSTLGGGGSAYTAYVALSFSCGYRHAIDKKHMLQFGVFIDFALNRTAINSSNGMVDIGNDVAFHPVLQSSLVQSLRHIDCGISVTYNFTFGQRIGFHHYKSMPFPQSRRHRRYRW